MTALEQNYTPEDVKRGLSPILLFCKGKNCALKEHCFRFAFREDFNGKGRLMETGTKKEGSCNDYYGLKSIFVKSIAK